VSIDEKWKKGRDSIKSASEIVMNKPKIKQRSPGLMRYARKL